ncbi:putative ABC transporter [Myxozyma melibiosi]|uniref:ABC transporter n=1 Tax=Myxozyma melibiosi TaxID=54550 RepID=A0ABR1F5K7_9ASCO
MARRSIATALKYLDKPAGVADSKKKKLTGLALYAKYYTRFFPYVWPYNDRRLQVNAALCLLIMLISRAVNILMPYQLGRVTDILSTYEQANGGNIAEKSASAIPWTQITLYLALRYVQGHGSILGFYEKQLWTKISQASMRSLALLGFGHALELGVDYHLTHGPSDIITTLERHQAILGFVEKITFQMIPLAIDIVLAVGYFLVAFDRYYATIVICIATTYVWASTRLSKSRGEQKRKFYGAYAQEYTIKHDAISAFETVKYFNANQYEQDRYREAIDNVQKISIKYQASNHLLGLMQNTIFTLVLLFSCFFSAYKVITGEIKVGSFVMLLTYMKQLQHPLDQLTNFLKSTQDNLVSAEKLIQMLETVPTVVDSPNAKKLEVKKGEIVFDNVSFKYPGASTPVATNPTDTSSDDDCKKQQSPQLVKAITDFSLTCPAGSTIAFVGESGGGKSTLFRLLFRFYDVASGKITIDGQDIRDVQLSSLASAIGVVPQECSLFNDTIMYNLRYAKQDATDEEIYAAARAASIHDKIMRFPEGYDTVVGERGLRLSGGEKQRIAIARAILKDPPILLLDEATAMLDIESERHIQRAIRELSKNRTTLVIAHRLSTIISADVIVVVHDGQIVEYGSHRQLVAARGAYFNMWKKQVAPMFADQAKGENEDEIIESMIDHRPVLNSRKGAGVVNPAVPEEKKASEKRKNSVFINDLDI